MSINELDTRVNQIRSLKRLIEDAEAEITGIEAEIKATMTKLDTDELRGSTCKVTWRQTNSTRIDSKAIKQGRKLKPGYEFDDAVQSTAEGVLKVLKNPTKLDADTERRESQGKAGNTLEAIVCRAANNAMQGIAYYSNKDSKATSRTITSEDGDEIDVLDTIAATENVEDSVIIQVTLQQFINGLDDTNKKIIARRIQGMTEREIAPTVGITNVAVHNRLTKLEKALAEML